MYNAIMKQKTYQQVGIRYTLFVNEYKLVLQPVKIFISFQINEVFWSAAFILEVDAQEHWLFWIESREIFISLHRDASVVLLLIRSFQFCHTLNENSAWFKVIHVTNRIHRNNKQKQHNSMFNCGFNKVSNKDKKKINNYFIEAVKHWVMPFPFLFLCACYMHYSHEWEVWKNNPLTSWRKTGEIGQGTYHTIWFLKFLFF